MESALWQPPKRVILQKDLLPYIPSVAHDFFNELETSEGAADIRPLPATDDEEIDDVEYEIVHCNSSTNLWDSVNILDKLI